MSTLDERKLEVSRKIQPALEKYGNDKAATVFIRFVQQVWEVDQNVPPSIILKEMLNPDTSHFMSLFDMVMTQDDQAIDGEEKKLLEDLHQLRDSWDKKASSEQDLSKFYPVIDALYDAPIQNDAPIQTLDEPKAANSRAMAALDERKVEISRKIKPVLEKYGDDNAATVFIRFVQQVWEADKKVPLSLILEEMLNPDTSYSMSLFDIVMTRDDGEIDGEEKKLLEDLHQLRDSWDKKASSKQDLSQFHPVIEALYGAFTPTLDERKAANSRKIKRVLEQYGDDKTANVFIRLMEQVWEVDHSVSTLFVFDILSNPKAKSSKGVFKKFMYDDDKTIDGEEKSLLKDLRQLRKSWEKGIPSYDDLSMLHSVINALNDD